MYASALRIRQLFGFGLAFFAFILIPNTLLATVIYVPGDYPTIADALHNVSDYDTVLVAPGTYYGFNYLGNAQAPEHVTIMGSGWPNGTVIHNLPNPEIWAAMRIENVHGWRITDFEVTSSLNGIAGHYCSAFEFDHNYIHGMSNTYSTGYNLEYTYNSAWIHHNLIVNIRYSGIYMGEGSHENIYIYNNTLNNIPTHEAIEFRYYNPSGCVVTNNIITNSEHGVGFVSCNQMDTEVSYNCVYNTNGPWVNLPNPGIGNIFDNPQFLMEPTIPEYYFLSENSPCIDTGNPDPIYNDPDGTRADMGAYPLSSGLIALQIGWENAYPADTVHVPISITDVTGLDVISSEFVISYPDDDLELLSVSIPDSSLAYQAGWSLDYDDINGTLIAIIEGLTPLTGSGLLALMSYVLDEYALPDTVWNIRFQSALISYGVYIPNTIDGGVRMPHGIIYGDVDLNGYVALHDVSLLFEYLTGYEPLSFYQLHIADVSDSIGITAYDGSLITQYCFEQFPLFPVEGGIVEMYATGMLSIPEASVYAGEEVEIPIIVQNGINISAVEVEMTVGGAYVELTEIIGPGQGAWFSRVGGEYPMFHPYLAGSEAIQGNQQLCQLTFGVPDTATGTFSITLSDVMLNETDIGGQVYQEFNIQPAEVHLNDPSTPVGFSFSPAYPNPFNPRTNLVFSIPTSSYVTLKIYNLLGQGVDVLVARTLVPGRYSIPWDASIYPSGIYVVELIAGSNKLCHKLLVMK